MARAVALVAVAFVVMVAVMTALAMTGPREIPIPEGQADA